MNELDVKISSAFDGIENVNHGFFGRAGGVSEGKYQSLNTGQGSEDNPMHVSENRHRVAATLGTREPLLLSAHQCHSKDVVIVDGPWDGTRPKVDGLVTKTKNIAVSALAADCAPVLFVDPDHHIIGAAHAGWRGALSGITDKTIEAMESIGAKRTSIRAAVGPCISLKHFEVGPEFVDVFLADDSSSEDLFKAGASDRSYFDIKTYLVRRLTSFGCATATALPDCTYDRPDAYFSYRYNSHTGIADYGRNISAIMLK